MLNMEKIKVNDESIVLGVTQSWQRNRFEYSFVILQLVEWFEIPQCI